MSKVKILVRKSGFNYWRFQDDFADGNFWCKSKLSDTNNILVSKDIPDCRPYWNRPKRVQNFAFKIAWLSTRLFIW